MFGFATNETPEFMPMPVMTAHKLCMRLTEARRSGELEWLRPDGKSQVSVEYEGGTPRRIEAVVVSCQHSEAVSTGEIREEVLSKVIREVIPASLMDDATKVLAQDGKIMRIGKRLEVFNCVDTGLFVCTRALFDALDQVQQSRSDASLSERLSRSLTDVVILPVLAILFFMAAFLSFLRKDVI